MFVTGMQFLVNLWKKRFPCAILSPHNFAGNLYEYSYSVKFFLKLSLINLYCYVIYECKQREGVKSMIEMKKLNFIDLKMLQLAAAMLTIVLVKLFPSITSLNIGWYVLFGFFLAIIPVYKLLKP